MKKYAELFCFISLLLLIITLFLIKEDIIVPSSLLATAVGFMFYASLVIYWIFLYFLLKDNKYEKLKTKFEILTITIIISFFIFQIFYILDYANGVIGYIYIYLIFPYLLITFLVLVIVLSTKKQFVVLKSIFLKMLLWAVIFTVGALLFHLLR